jgi:hypothetical protein
MTLPVDSLRRKAQHYRDLATFMSNHEMKDWLVADAIDWLVAEAISYEKEAARLDTGDSEACFRRP